jgi:alpha-galactosidase
MRNLSTLLIITIFISVQAIAQVNNVPDTGYYILTPKALPVPKINSPANFGAREGKDFMYTLAVSGKRPIKLAAYNLPEGVKFDKTTGILTGNISRKGTYTIQVSASNNQGKASKKLNLIIGNRLALTPPMSWCSWYSYGRTVTQEKIEKSAAIMKEKGLQNYGWNIIEIDDPWTQQPPANDSVWIKLENKQATVYGYYEKANTLPAITGAGRDTRGELIPNTRFKNIKGLVSNLHSMGFKAGIYSSPGPLTCCGVTGSYGYEYQDAKTWADWGVDYLKYDWCSYGVLAKNNTKEELMKPYVLMSKALQAQKRDIIHAICQYGLGNVWEWGDEAGGQLWRTEQDIRDDWETVSNAFLKLADKAAYVRPGNWNDPDILQLGVVGANENGHSRSNRLTAHEQYTHMSMWCLLSAPLMLGADVEKLDAFTLNLLTNEEVIAINQDALGKAAQKIAILDNNVQVWTKPLEDGSIAVGLFNPSDKKTETTFSLNTLKMTGNYKIRDVWRNKDIGVIKDQLKVNIPPHGIFLIKMKKV